MTHPFIATLGLLALLTPAFAEGPSAPVSKVAVANSTLLTRQANELLRANGTILRMDQDITAGTTPFRKEINRVYFNSNSKENRLVSIVVQPLGNETPDTSVLTASFLCVLSAVSDIEEGVSFAKMITKENEKDGRPRSITLRNGVKLLKYKAEDSAPRFVIAL